MSGIKGSLNLCFIPQLEITNESQDVSPFPAGDHKASINRHARNHNKHKTEIT